MHSSVDGHAMPYMVVPVTLLALQAFAPPVGSDELRTLPRLSTAKHSEAEGQERPNSERVRPTGASVHAEPPPAASVVVSSDPELTEATHKPVELHETPANLAGATGVLVTLHADAPPEGLVEVTTWPFWSTATHMTVVHERLRNPPLNVGPGATDHAAVPPVGFEEVTMLASPSSATHEVVDGHETVCRPWVSP